MPEDPSKLEQLASLAAPKDFHGEVWHTLEGRAIREIIFGINDGLITAFGFVAGVSGAQIPPLLIFLTGLAEAIAGAISMFFGAYLSTKAQREFFQGEIEREKREIETEPEKETEEIREIYRLKGFSEEEIQFVVKRITSNKERWLSFMLREELGLIPERFDNPWRVASQIGLSFLAGALIPVIPYLFAKQISAAILLSASLTLAALFAVGAGKTKITKTSWLSGGFEMLLIGIIAGGIGLGVGKLIAILHLTPY